MTLLHLCAIIAICATLYSMVDRHSETQIKYKSLKTKAPGFRRDHIKNSTRIFG